MKDRRTALIIIAVLVLVPVGYFLLVSILQQIAAMFA
jgi:hypothetical protein